jgi:hypothetical protein
VGSVQAQVSCPGFDAEGTAVNIETGHTFYLYSSPEITWDEAQACVIQIDALDLEGDTPPHLATITSSSENQWIVGYLLLTEPPPAEGVPRLTLTQVWVGGFQETGAAEPDEGWRWVNFEGPIPVPGSSVTLGYSNWAPGEPNNTGAPSVNERHLTLGRYANLGLWNDEGASLNSIGGFVVEYDTPRTTTAGCIPAATSTECETVEGQTMTFPPGTFDEDSSFTFTAYEFTDPRVDEFGRCNVREQLTLFTDDSFNLPNTAPGSESGKLVIPEYLCGSPKFLVVRAQGENITVPRGVVITASDTPTILPGNLFDCNAPIPATKSPQEQDVGVWQSLDGTEMWENAPTVPVTRFAGTAAELTTACGSTLIKTRTKSNFVVGMHIDFGPTVDFRSTAEYNEMVALTQYKISLVRQSVVKARMVGSISNANGRAMISQLDNAAAFLAANDPVGARKKIKDFLSKVNTSTYSSTLQNPFNYNGDHLSRGENILFTLNHKVIPFKPAA